MIFFSTLGGLLTFGVPGFIIGPIIAALFVTVWEIYGVEFRDWLPDTNFVPHSERKRKASAAQESAGDSPDTDNEKLNYLDTNNLSANNSNSSHGDLDNNNPHLHGTDHNTQGEITPDNNTDNGNNKA